MSKKGVSLLGIAGLGVARKGIAMIAAGDAWTPAMITTEMWLDASKPETITLATGVSQWDDAKGDPRYVSQGTATKQPLYSAEEQSVTFGFRSDDWMAISSALPSSWWAAMVYKDYDGQSYRSPLTTNSLNVPFQFHGLFLGVYANGTIRTSATQIAVNDTNILEALIINGQNAIVYKNGGTEDTIANSNTLNAAAIEFGGRSAVNQGTGKYSEVIITPSDISSDDKQRVEGYLAWKWDAINGNSELVDRLPIDHPYKLARPMS